jgi:hypothetical protein
MKKVPLVRGEEKLINDLIGTARASSAPPPGTIGR